MKTKLFLAAAMAAISLGAASTQAAPGTIPGDVATGDTNSTVVPADYNHHWSYHWRINPNPTNNSQLCRRLYSNRLC